MSSPTKLRQAIVGCRRCGAHPRDQPRCVATGELHSSAVVGATAAFSMSDYLVEVERQVAVAVLPRESSIRRVVEEAEEDEFFGIVHESIATLGLPVLLLYPAASQEREMINEMEASLRHANEMQQNQERSVLNNRAEKSLIAIWRGDSDALLQNLLRERTLSSSMQERAALPLRAREAKDRAEGRLLSPLAVMLLGSADAKAAAVIEIPISHGARSHVGSSVQAMQDRDFDSLARCTLAIQQRQHLEEDEEMQQLSLQRSILKDRVRVRARYRRLWELCDEETSDREKIEADELGRRKALDARILPWTQVFSVEAEHFRIRQKIATAFINNNEWIHRREKEEQEEAKRRALLSFHQQQTYFWTIAKPQLMERLVLMQHCASSRRDIISAANSHWSPAKGRRSSTEAIIRRKLFLSNQLIELQADAAAEFDLLFETEDLQWQTLVFSLPSLGFAEPAAEVLNPLGSKFHSELILDEFENRRLIEADWRSSSPVKASTDGEDPVC